MKPRVLFVLPDLDAGGAQFMNARLAQELRARKWQVRVAALFDRGHTGLLERLAGLPVTRLGTDNIYHKPLIPFRLAVLAAKADIVIGGMEFAATNYAFVAAKIASRPFLSWTHTAMEHHEQVAGPIDRLVTHAIYRRCRNIVFPSQGAANSLRKALEVKTRGWRWQVIHNFLERPHSPSPIYQQPLKNEEVFSRPVIVGVGRMVPEKGFDRLIRAHSWLRSRGIEHHLMLLGEGPLRSELQNLCRELKVSSTVFMPGHVPDPRRWLIRCQVFALTSRYEGFSLALLEALDSCLPCVAMDCPSGPGEILENGKYGILTPPDDLDAFQQALEKMLTDAALRQFYARVGSERAKEYSADLIVPKWESLLLDIVRRSER